MGNIKQVDISHLRSYMAEGAIVDYPDKYYFNDKDVARYCNKLTKIVIQSNAFVDGIEFIYDDDVSAGIHGNYSSETTAFTLEDDEYINSVSWQTANAGDYGGYSSTGVVNYIEFKTNKGSVFASSSFGRDWQGWKNRKSFSYTTEENEEIVGLAGYSGSHIEWLYSLTKIYFRDRAAQYSPNEKYYNDYYYIYHCQRLAKIKIYHGWVIDKIQFVYTNSNGELDETITEMHGNGQGELSEICLSETEYISAIVYQSANTDYYDERVMYYLEIMITDSATGEGQCFAFGNAPYWRLVEWSHKHTYKLEAMEGYEIFALAGLYRVYMGELETVYYRKLNTVSPKVKRAEQVFLSINEKENKNEKEILNQTNAYILFINCTRIYNPESKTTDPDEVITNVYKRWKTWKGQNTVRLNRLYKEGDIDVLTDNQVTNAVVQRAVLSGQYRYISIRAHGLQTSIIGIENLPMLSKSMIEKESAQYKKALKDTVFNLFCCNCAYREEGLAVTLVKNNAKACFGFSVPLAFFSNSFDFLVSFASYIDNAILIEGKNVNKTAEKMLSQFDDYIQRITKLFELKEDITNVLKTKMKESDGDVRKWLEKKTNAADKYMIYWYMQRNKVHFCGPGPDKAKKAKDNYGELCNDFGDFDCFLQNGTWIYIDNDKEEHDSEL